MGKSDAGESIHPVVKLGKEAISSLGLTSYCFAFSSFESSPLPFAGTNFKTVPLMQYRLSVGVWNPSPIKINNPKIS